MRMARTPKFLSRTLSDTMMEQNITGAPRSLIMFFSPYYFSPGAVHSIVELSLNTLGSTTRRLCRALSVTPVPTRTQRTTDVWPARRVSIVQTRPSAESSATKATTVPLGPLRVQRAQPVRTALRRSRYHRRAALARTQPGRGAAHFANSG